MHAIAAGEKFERVIAPEQRVKHAFIHLCMHPEWIDLHLTIDINDRSMCSVNGGDWSFEPMLMPWHALARDVLTTW